MPRKIEISHKTIIFAVMFLLGLWFFYYIRDLVFQLFIALVIMTILNPFVSKITKIKIPRGFAILIVYIVVLGIFGLGIAGVIPPLVEQTTGFVNNLPHFLSRIGVSRFMSEQVTSQLLSQLGAIPAQALKFGYSVFSNVLSVLTVLIFAFYLLLTRDKLDTQLAFLFGEDKRREIGRIIDMLETRLGSWVRGELLLMLLVGTLIYIGLALLGIPFALPLAIIAGLLEIVPILGPIIAAVPSVIIGFTISPVMGLAAAALAFLVQQFENYVFVPKIMEKSTGVSPLITLFALAIGYRIAGPAGAVISMPVVLALQVVLREYFLSRQ